MLSHVKPSSWSWCSLPYHVPILLAHTPLRMLHAYASFPSQYCNVQNGDDEVQLMIDQVGLGSGLSHDLSQCLSFCVCVLALHVTRPNSSCLGRRIIGQSRAQGQRRTTLPAGEPYIRVLAHKLYWTANYHQFAMC